MSGRANGRLLQFVKSRKNLCMLSQKISRSALWKITSNGLQNLDQPQQVWHQDLCVSMCIMHPWGRDSVWSACVMSSQHTVTYSFFMQCFEYCIHQVRIAIMAGGLTYPSDSISQQYSIEAFKQSLVSEKPLALLDIHIGSHSNTDQNQGLVFQWQCPFVVSWRSLILTGPHGVLHKCMHFSPPPPTPLSISVSRDCWLALSLSLSPTLIPPAWLGSHVKMFGCLFAVFLLFCTLIH